MKIPLLHPNRIDDASRRSLGKCSLLSKHSLSILSIYHDLKPETPPWQFKKCCCQQWVEQKKQSFSLEFQRHLDHGVAKKWCSMPVASWVCTWHSWGSGEINDNHGTLVSPFEDLSCEWTEHVTPNMGNQIHLAINYITIAWKIVWIQTQSFQFSWMTKEETKWKLEEREMSF